MLRAQFAALDSIELATVCRCAGVVALSRRSALRHTPSRQPLTISRPATLSTGLAPALLIDTNGSYDRAIARTPGSTAPRTTALTRSRARLRDVPPGRGSPGGAMHHRTQRRTWGFTPSRPSGD